MKKILILILSAALFCSCGNEKRQATSPAESLSVTEAAVSEQTDIPEEGKISEKEKFTYPPVEYDLEEQTVFYGTFPPIEAIFEKNAEKLADVPMCGQAVLDEYISPNSDAAERSDVLRRVKELSDEICADCKTDSERLYAICDWVSRNIYYDFDARNSEVTAEVICLKNVLETKRTTCAGYATFTAALCGAQGIVCVDLRGGSSSEGWKRSELMDAPINHEWNGAIIDGKWVFCDTTWASQNSYENGAYFQNEPLTPFYYGLDFGQMSIEHRIDIAEFRDFYGIFGNNSPQNQG